MVLIDFATAREILDSRGYPTVQAKIVLNDGSFAVASVPSGVSKSTFEAIELRDTEAGRYGGMGVQHAVKNINEIISPRLKKMNPLEQQNIDKLLNELDQTPNKVHLGANATLAISMAVARAATLIVKKPLWGHLNDLFMKQRAKNIYSEEAKLIDEQLRPQLPVLIFVAIEAGKHSKSSIPFQEFILIPSREMSISEQIRAGAEIRHILNDILDAAGTFYGVGDEGAVSAQFENEQQVFELLAKAVKQSGRALGKDITFGIDVAADSIDNFQAGSTVEMYKHIIGQFPITLLEDPLQSRDMIPWTHLRALLHENLKIVGDDLIATNAERLREALKNKAIDLTIIKPNQAGTISETLETAKVAKHHGAGLVVSHRGGDTNDSFISDLAVALGADYLKAGSPVRGERIAKYNRMLEIMDENNW